MGNSRKQRTQKAFNAIDLLHEGIEAHFAERANERDLDASIHHLSVKTLEALNKIAEDIREVAQRRMPDAKVGKLSGKDLLPSFIEYLNGKQWHDPDEWK